MAGARWVLLRPPTIARLYGHLRQLHAAPGASIWSKAFDHKPRSAGTLPPSPRWDLRAARSLDLRTGGSRDLVTPRGIVATLAASRLLGYAILGACIRLVCLDTNSTRPRAPSPASTIPKHLRGHEINDLAHRLWSTHRVSPPIVSPPRGYVVSRWFLVMEMARLGLASTGSRGSS